MYSRKKENPKRILDTVLIGALEVDDTWVFIGLDLGVAGLRHTAQNPTSSKVTECGTSYADKGDQLFFFTDRSLHKSVSTVDTGLREKA